MATTQKLNASGPGVVTYVVSWLVGVGVFALLVLAGLWLIQE